MQLTYNASAVGIWAERFDQPLDDLFVLQEDMANHIAASVDTRVGRQELRRTQHLASASLDDYDLYLQGRELHGNTTEKETLLASQQFDRAILADPLYAPARAWQGGLLWARSWLCHYSQGETSLGGRPRPPRRR